MEYAQKSGNLQTRVPGLFIELISCSYHAGQIVGH